MPTSAVSLREPRLESDALAALRRLQHIRPLSVISDASPLRWRYGERLDEVLEEACRRYADLTAVAADNADVSFRELSARANQMARFFLRKGVKPGDRVAVLLDRRIEAYVALFALLKVRAAYVPLDANHPPERVRFILSDAAASLVVTHLRLADRFADCETPTLVVDGMRAEIAALDGAPLSDDERAPAPDSLCYVLYTSGTTGHPKGVAVAHASICNFVRVAAEHYGFGPGDRVYQGMSVAFDFSIEEIWVPLAAGATLVPNTAAMSLFGEELADLLEERDVTCLCCVPTLLASIDRDLPKLRILLIGGEPCPPTLVKRWSRPARVLLNSYGPTETTVTATLGIMTPDKPVTIGRPLPTYSIAILDPKRDIALELGEAGEIGIAGIGVAEGYLDRPELTAAKFVDDFLALPNNPSGRIYRTGDLGRVNANWEIEYLGRIDTQIKLRGYRIELTEIESVLLETPEIAQVAVTTFEPEPGAPELIAYYSVKHGSPAPDRGAMVAHLRSRLPSYMTPSYLEPLPFIPTLVSNKADRERLPAPKTARLRLSETAAAPSTPTERMLCRALSETLGIEQVSIDGDFFTDYGAHSLLMARFCARVRQIAALGARRDARRLRECDHSPARAGHGRRPGRRDGRTRYVSGASAVEPRLLRLRRAANDVLCDGRRACFWRGAGEPRMGVRRRRSAARALRARARCRRRLVHRPQRAGDWGQMAAPRAGARRDHSIVEPRLFPLLGGAGSSFVRRRPTLSPARRCSMRTCACSARTSAAMRSLLRASCRSPRICSKSGTTPSSPRARCCRATERTAIACASAKS